MVKTGSAWAGSFVTLDATGALSASADAAGVLYVDGTANAATVTITGSNPYKWSVTLPSLTAGQRVDMYITGTIATIATAGFVASEQADTALLSDGVVVNSGTVTTLTNLPAAPTDWLTGAAVKADAVAKLQANLALEATLTAIKGAGWDTQTLAAIDVLIDAIKAKTDLIPATPAQAGEYTAAIAAIPTTGLTAQQVWEYVTRELTSSSGGGATAQEVWEYATRVLTAGTNLPTAAGVADAVWDEAIAGHAAVGSAGAGLAAAGSAGDPWSTALPGAYGAGTAGLALSDILAKTDQLDVSSTSFVTAVSGSTITILRGDTFSGDLLNLGSLSSYVSLDFTVKRGSGESDDDAIIRIRKNATGLTDGLVRLNGAAYTTGTDGSITITDAPTGDITIMLKAAVTDDLVPGSYVYDIQLIEAAGVTTLTTGGLVVTADVTRLVA